MSHADRQKQTKIYRALSQHIKQRIVFGRGGGQSCKKGEVKIPTAGKRGEVRQTIGGEEEGWGEGSRQ